MINRLGAVVLTSSVLLAAGCQKPTPTINDSMTHVMQPQAQTIWDITSRAFNEKGDGLDASKLTPTDWAQLEKAAQQMSDRAHVLATAKHITVASAGETIMGQDASHTGAKKTWDAASPEQVQNLIDANPAGFAQHAQVLAQAMDNLVNAARAKDANVVYQVSSNLDENCDGCHQPFWGTDEPPPFPKK